MRKKAVPSSKRSYDKKVWKQLWDLSESMVGLAETQKEETTDTEYFEDGIQVEAEETAIEI